MKKYVVVEKETQRILKSQNYIYNKEMKNVEIEKNIDVNIFLFNNINQSLKIDVKEDSVVNIYNVILTNENNNINIEVNLLEHGATVNIVSLLLSTNSSNINSNVKIYHNVSHTFSDFKCYCISKDESIINLNNNAYIKNKSKGSVAKQNTKGLTLSNTSKIIAQPNLFIDEFDVSASHGVAMGSLNKDDLFYLMSRGLTYKDAAMIVIMGFISPIIDKIDNKKYGQIIQDKFNELLG